MKGGNLMLHHKILTSMLHFLWRERGASTMGLRAKNRWGGCSREDIEVLQYLFEKDGRRKRNLTLSSRNPCGKCGSWAVQKSSEQGKQRQLSMPLKSEINRMHVEIGTDREIQKSF